MQETAAQNARDSGWILVWGGFLGEENGNPLQYSGLENSMDRGAWRAYSPWGGKELDMTERLTRSLSPFLGLAPTLAETSGSRDPTTHVLTFSSILNI